MGISSWSRKIGQKDQASLKKGVQNTDNIRSTPPYPDIMI